MSLSKIEVPFSMTKDLGCVTGPGMFMFCLSGQSRSMRQQAVRVPEEMPHSSVVSRVVCHSHRSLTERPRRFSWELWVNNSSRGGIRRTCGIRHSGSIGRPRVSVARPAGMEPCF